MLMELRSELTAGYPGATQRIRVMTESWVGRNMYCPSCSNDRIEPYRANNVAADFVCRACGADYELKSSGARLGRKVVDGAYGTLMGRLLAGRAPNLLLLTYDRRALAVRDLVAVPGHFFTPAIVEKRKPLAPTARRRGWVGCNILVGDLPQAGRLSVIHEGVVQDKGQVRATWQATVFLEGNSPTEGRSWLIEVMRSIERLARPDFTLADLYADEARLGQVFPGNAHVRPKIRQQLQILRDRGYLSFQGSGRYRLSDATA